MFSDTKIIEIFCNLDDFMKEFEAVLIKHSISDTSLPIAKTKLKQNLFLIDSILKNQSRPK